jgi:hypothetical protein
MKVRVYLSLLAFALLALPACQDPDWANRAALQIGAPRSDAPQIRERQTARFQVTSEERLLVEATQVLQDLGFTVEESAPRFGVLAGTKDRDAVEAPQVVGQMALAIGFALLGVQYNPVWDTDQIIRATLSTRSLGPREVALRVSFERIVTNNQGASRVEELTAPGFSSGFFEQVRSGLVRRT